MPFSLFLKWGICFALFSLMNLQLVGQDKSDDIEYYRYKGEDTLKGSPLSRVQTRLKNIRPTEKFDIILNYGFMLSVNQPDSVPIRTSGSGTRFVGISLNYLVAPNFALKVQPGFSFFKISFDQNSKKTFPSPSDSANQEKLRAEYFEVPLALTYIIQTDTVKGKFVSFVEAGFSAGYKIGSSYKLSRIEDGQQVKVKLPGIDGLETWRLGVFAKLTYRFVGLWAYYRLTPLFTESEQAGGFRYPQFSPWEIGFSIIL